MSSKTYRLREFINPSDGRSLVLDASAGLSLGPLPGMEELIPAVQPMLALIDGLVASPGAAGKLTGRTRTDGALLVRSDWTNAFRGPDFVLPMETISHAQLLDPGEALDLGASALVTYFLLGFEEEIEAGCLRSTVRLSLEGSRVGMPLIVDVQPIGPRVVLRNKAIELGVSYALEGGADGVAVPLPDRESLQDIMTMAAGAPIWVKPSTLQDAQIELGDALQMGAAGLWLDHRLFAQTDPKKELEVYHAQLHAPQPTP
jgi:DhnA family fructose-bisphosphate aldolase class Ia